MKRHPAMRAALRGLIQNAHNVVVLTPFGACYLSGLDIRSAIRVCRDGHMLGMSGQMGGAA